MRWVLWGLAVAFFFYEFLLRVSPSVLVTSLMLSFGIDAGAVGALSGLYYYTYAPMQIPVGMLLDRYGAPKLLGIAATICGVSGVLFGLSFGISLLSIARLMMGFGSSFAFVGLAFVTAKWFEAKRLALLLGLANALSMLGAVAGEGPVGLAEGVIGWRATMVCMGVMGILLGFLILFFSRKMPAHKKTASALKGLKEVFTNRQTWLTALIAFAIYTTTSAFAALWGVPFLMNNHGLELSAAGFVNSMIYVGWAIGGPLIGWLSDRSGARVPLITLGSLAATLLLLPVVLFTHLPLWVLVTCLTLVGICSTGEILAFCLVIEQHPARGSGSAIAFTNFIIMLGGGLFQPFIGWLLDRISEGAYHDGVQVFSIVDYQIVMMVFPILFFIAFFLSFLLKEPNLGDA